MSRCHFFCEFQDIMTDERKGAQHWGARGTVTERTAKRTVTGIVTEATEGTTKRTVTDKNIHN